ncbi:MAG TPA: CAP domain-containing protein [Pyrinomonadaceae bacterium]|nr:CAP domain-containing protein [Pyrinomonadaceae bacterium]
MYRTVLFVLLLLLPASLAQPAATLNIPADASIAVFSAESDESIELQILALVNRQRERQHRRELGWDEQLARVARNYSRRMARERFFAHYDPEGHTVTDRASRIAGWRRIGENLFFCDRVDGLAAFSVDGWLHSSAHRANMLDPDWTASGVGIARSNDGEIYITQIFTGN